MCAMKPQHLPTGPNPSNNIKFYRREYLLFIVYTVANRRLTLSRGNVPTPKLAVDKKPLPFSNDTSNRLIDRNERFQKNIWTRSSEAIIENTKMIRTKGLTVSKNGVLIRPSIPAGDSRITVLSHCPPTCYFEKYLRRFISRHLYSKTWRNTHDTPGTLITNITIYNNCRENQICLGEDWSTANYLWMLRYSNISIRSHYLLPFMRYWKR